MAAPAPPSLRTTAWRVAVAAAAAFVLGVASAPARAIPEADDPIARELARWRMRIGSAPTTDEEAKGIREGLSPLLESAARELDGGRRWFALSRLAYSWTNLAAVDYRDRVAAESGKGMPALEAEWKRLGPTLEAAKRGEGWPSFEQAPAVARAFGEVAQSETGGYFDSSLEYGKATAPEYGLFYLGAAEAQLGLARTVAAIRADGPPVAPLAPRSIDAEIERVENELLAAYRPPASVDFHSVFIRIAGLLKQAREMEHAGLRYGAVQRLLDAKMRLERLVHAERKLDLATSRKRAAEVGARLAASGRDATLAQLFVEIALVQVADPDPAQMGPETAAAVFDAVLPLYFEILGPAPPAPAEVVAQATVTLVRWPYT